jgi:hypothetical protein
MPETAAALDPMLLSPTCPNPSPPVTVASCPRPKEERPAVTAWKKDFTHALVSRGPPYGPHAILSNKQGM